jgi:hypothetical protein
MGQRNHHTERPPKKFARTQKKLSPWARSFARPVAIYCASLRFATVIKCSFFHMLEVSAGLKLQINAMRFDFSHERLLDF